MTLVIQNELDARVNELALMYEVIDLKRVNGLEPTPKAITAITTTETKITELQAILAERLKAQK